jgi:two-component system, chemotaxis family, response regulator WspF
MKIAIVNDLMIAVEALRRTILTVPGYKVAWVAKDGGEAVTRCKQEKPDLILMDLIMPVMDGVEATRKIMAESPCPILVVTATVTGNFAKVYEAMGHGALDAVNTPVLGAKGEMEGAEPFLQKMRTVERLIGYRHQPGEPVSQNNAQADKVDDARQPIVGIGVSTGGPDAISQVLAQLPKMGAPIVIIQHIGAEFAPGLAQWLRTNTGHDVRVAMQGEKPEPNRVYLAATDDHLVLLPSGRFDYTPVPREVPYRPSVDVFFKSLLAAPVVGVGVLLTGMGRDGADGLLRLRHAGWHTIAQDKASSIMYGMPKAAAELNAAVQILPLTRIPQSIVEHLPVQPRTTLQ